MAKKYYLLFVLRGQEEDLIVGVRKTESERLLTLLDEHNADPLEARFFWFETTDGRSIALNLSQMQAVRYLWDPSKLPPDSTRGEEVIKLQFRGRAAIIEAYTGAPDQLYDLYTSLQHGPDVVSFPRFEDEDGEIIQINPTELVWISSPTHLLREGESQITNEEGLAKDGDA